MARFFIDRPIFAWVIAIVIMLAGALSIHRLALEQYPDIAPTQVSISTSYPGASAKTLEDSVTQVIEQKMQGLDHLQSMSSTSSSNGQVRVTLAFTAGTNSDVALMQVQNKVQQALTQLPDAVQDQGVTVTKAGTDNLLMITMVSDDPSVTATDIGDFNASSLIDVLSRIDGVSEVSAYGSGYAMRIWLDPRKLEKYALMPSDVTSAITAQNTQVSAGQLGALPAAKGQLLNATISARSRLTRVDQFKDIIVKSASDGTVVRLADVARVELGSENYNYQTRFNGKSSSAMGVKLATGANALSVADAVKAKLKELEPYFPSQMRAEIGYDTTPFIKVSIEEVVITLVEAIVLVVAVMYLFMQNLRATLIPAITVPVVLLGTFGVLAVFGYSINTLTMFGTVLAIGLLVDDAIVVVENVERHLREGLKPFDAAIQGARELVGPVIAMTITLAAVYAPIGLQSGVTGALFREFAFTLAGAVVVSGFVALTLTPMLSSKMLRHNPNRKGFEALLERGFEKLRQFYEHLLERVLANRPAVVLVTVLIFASIVPFFKMSQSELAPTEDRGFVLGLISGAPNATMEQTQRYTAQLQPMFNESFPEVGTNFLIIGFDPMSDLPTASGGMAGLVLKPWDQRARGAEAIANHLNGAVGAISGMKFAAVLPSSLPGSSGGLPVQYVVSSTQDHSRVVEVAEELMKRALASGMFVYADNGLKYDQPQADIVVDKDKAALLGIDMQALGADLGSMLGGGYVNRFSIDGRAYKVTPQVTRASRLTTEQLGNYYISTGSGKLVPLSTIATIEPTITPRNLTRFQQLNCATIGLVPRPGVTLGDALTWLNNEARQVFPEGFTADYKGEIRQYVQEGSSLITTFALAIIVIFLVLAAQYESWRDPFIVMLAVPLSLAGALVFLFLGFATINIYTQVGLITLVGLITKHGILMVDFANGLQEQGCTVREAIERAAGVRLRPILMTTAAMVLGVLPLVFAKGAGAESRYSMGLVIATGMSIGTFFTLFVVPVFYTFIAADRRPKPATVAAASHH